VTQISVDVQDKAVRLSLEKLGRAVPGITDDEIKDGLPEVLKEAAGGYSGGASYAVPPPPGSSYVRTGNYGRSFFWEKNGFTYVIKNEAYHQGKEYGVYVGGRADGSGQAWMHAGRWPRIIDVVRKWAEEKLVAKIESKLSEFIRREGLGL
jgi:hypothetical protein